MLDWSDAQAYEKNWWGTCTNSYTEETKQLAYAKKMGLLVVEDHRGPHIDVGGKSILDIGGGPVSLLLKCDNLGRSLVVDPCSFPKWVYERYEKIGIKVFKNKAEDVDLNFLAENFYFPIFDECWIYNVLQHVEDPAKIIANAKNRSRIIRVFEWLDIGICPGHIHDLHEQDINMWLNGEGKVVPAKVGKEYFGIFKGDHYEEKV